MGDKDKRVRNVDRRDMLKSIGSAAVFPISGVSIKKIQSQPDFRQVLNQSHRILQAAGVEKQHQYLRERGISTAKRSVSYDMPVQPKGPTTQTLVTSEISLTFSLYSDCDYHYPNGTYVAELTWKYDASWDDTGSKPMDYVGIGWDDNTWYYEDNNMDDLYSNSGYVNYEDGTSGSGPAWTVNDRYTLDNGKRWDGQDYYYVGVELVWNGEDGQKDNRTIAASYSHTWNSVNITSVSVSYPYGVSVGVSDTNDRWNKGRDDDGNFLRLRYNDLSGCQA